MSLSPPCTTLPVCFPNDMHCTRQHHSLINNMHLFKHNASHLKFMHLRPTCFYRIHSILEGPHRNDPVKLLDQRTTQI